MSVDWEYLYRCDEARITALEGELAMMRELRRTDNAAGAKLVAELRTNLADEREAKDVATVLLEVADALLSLQTARRSET